MSYAPSTFHAGTGEDFFRKEGFLVDGMAPLISARYTIPALDDYDGTAITITDSVAKAASGAATSWAGWDFASSISKGLMVAYIQPSTSLFTGVGFHVGTLPAAAVQNTYQAVFAPVSSRIEIGEHTSGSFTVLGTDSTIYQDDVTYAAAWGIALYVDGSSNVQKVFVKSGTGEWIQVLSTTDSDHSSFQSCYLRSYGANARFTTPIYCWGS